nr:MAG: hypothetical protein [Microvirus sp.]
MAKAKLKPNQVQDTIEEFNALPKEKQIQQVCEDINQMMLHLSEVYYYLKAVKEAHQKDLLITKTEEHA